MSREAVIGLEIHAQLLTRTKIFCGCSTAFGSPPNTHVCPVCLGFPGVLPVLNREAVDLGIRAALALGCHINERSVFARKNYFYPDLPKGYQISQYEEPLATNGVFKYVGSGFSRSADDEVAAVEHRVGITRVHLEEDAGKSLHEGFPDSDRRTYLDFNRAGTPLIEIVTEPDLRSAADAAEFFARLREILVWLGVNDGNMEEGSLRCDANVSVRPRGATTLGVKTEIKNLNSFRFVQKALEFEISRQSDLLDSGGRVRQETRLWDTASSTTVSMRSKEEAHDYRYFPEPDLPTVVVTRERLDAIRAAMPELPEARRARFVETYGLPEYDAAHVTQSRELADFFEETVRAGAAAKAASNWIMGDVARVLNATGRTIAESPVTPAQLGELILLIERGTISGAIAKNVFEKMAESGRPPGDIVRDEGLSQIDDESSLVAAVSAAMTGNADAVAQYRAGKGGALGFLVGQVMKATGGKANPRRVNELLKRELERA